MLSRGAAYIVQRTVYTIRWKDGRTNVRSRVETSIWERQPAGWRLVHIHESWQGDDRPTVRMDSADDR